VAGAGVVAASSIAPALGKELFATSYDIYAVTGDRYFDNTLKVVDALGGMRRFVHQGSSVGILVNSPLNHTGAYTKPDITVAVVKMCLDAGAKDVFAINDIGSSYWRRAPGAASMQSEIGRIRHSGEMTDVVIERGKALKKAEVYHSLLGCDVYITIPIIKDHEGTRFTCSLKNTMGACSGSTCRRFHFGEGGGLLEVFKGYYHNIDLLAQSIADINLVRQPDLCVVDATEFLVTNGPSGPGELRRPREIFAATNCLAGDMYAVRHLNLDWEELPVLRCARELGYGPSDLREITVHAA
jgi:uncharacterized protein (DUF362 family)